MRQNFTIILLLSFFSYAQGQLDNLREEVSKIIRYDTDIDFDRTPASVIGVVDLDSTFIFTIGKDEFTANLDGNSVFEIGSVSKVITSSIISILIEEGKIDKTKPINDYLPSHYRNPRLDALTIWDLLNHYGGFPKIPKMFGAKQKKILDPYAHYTKIDLLNYYRDYIPTSGSKQFDYSHIGYALLEIIIEEIEQKSFHDISKEKLFAPLDMTNTFIDFTEKKNIVAGFNLAMRKVLPWHFSSFAGSEGVKSTVSDLCKFIKSHFEEPGIVESVALSNNTIVEAKTSYNDKIMIGNGWHIYQQSNKYDVYAHTGKTSGHSAFIALIKETNTGVVILSNSTHGTRDLGMLILRMVNDNWNRKI